MATIQEIITNIVRVDISDEIGSRFTDTQLLTFFKQAIRRTQGIGYKKRLVFMRKTLDFTLFKGTNQYLLPTDFIVQEGVWRKDTNRPILPLNINQWECMNSSSEVSYYVIDVDGTDTHIKIASAPSADTPVRIRYYFDTIPNSLTLSSNMPWNSKLDYVIADYVNLRAFHVDRYDLSADYTLLQDMENQIVEMFTNLEPNMAEARGGFY